MGAGAIGPIIGLRPDQITDQFDHRDRCLPRRSAKLALAFVLGAMALAACAWDPPTIERTPREAAGTETNAKSRLAARKGVQNGTPSGAPGEKIDVPGTEMAALEVDLTNFKERLIGLDSDEINDLMGTPGLERAEPPALIWQYRHQVCTVDIFMFDDGGGATVDHVEVRPTTAGSGVNEKDCFTALLRNAPQSGGASAKAPSGQQPIAPAPSTPVTRRPGAAAGAASSAPAPSVPATTRPPVPSSAAPSAAPTVPPTAGPDGEDGPPPTDTDIDFDFGAPPAATGPRPGAAAPSPMPFPSAQDRPPSAAPSSEAIPTLPPELMDEKPQSAAPAAPSAAPRPSSSLGIEIPAQADAEEFADPLVSAPPAKPSPAMPSTSQKPAPAPLAAVPPAPAAAPAIPPVPPAPVAAPVPPAPVPSSEPAPLAPRAPTATAAVQPKGAPKGAAARPAVDIDDDLPPDALTGLRDDDPSHNNEDLVE